MAEINEGKCMTLIRKLDKQENYYESNPIGMAQLHHRLEGVSNNPYKLGTVECGEYINAFQKIMFREELSA
jgi:hypothetical protein